jgi:D-alanyl-lipoteichoic acid acyltransferase DltB (MBOAT superfamily)
MNFVQVEFLWFFAILFGLYWAIGRRTWQNALLIAASAIFYGWIHPWFLILLYVSAIVDYLAGLGMERYPAHKRAVLAVSLSANLGLLGFYKYFDFFAENLAGALDLLGVHNSVRPLGIFLPPGISFYTFQSMAYSIDIYRGEMKARKNLLDYLLAVSFFAHLVAGPVQRASNLLLQAETPRKFEIDRIRSGLALALWGAVKKVVVADTISPYVDKIFVLREPSSAMVWAATLGFTVQILADFSGYTDIARGTARMLGWELMENFKHPYLAANPSDFWRRWHVSFSNWIRDYVYISFGGSKGSFARTTAATFGAMVLSGLWHGASWNFVLWGGYHAALLTGYRVVTPKIPEDLRKSRFGSVSAVGIMFCFTVFGWLLFRETDLRRIVYFLSLDPLAGTSAQWLAATVMLAMVAVTAAPLVAGLLVEKYVLPDLEEREWFLPVETATWAAFAVAIFLFVRVDGGDFIYFQF